MPIRALQQLMGHSSIETARDFYITVADANQRAAADLYERLVAVPVGEGQAAGKTDAGVRPASVGE